MIKDWNFWFSVITAFVAIIALFLSVRQIQLSNKQQLFERRLNAYMITNGLIELYKQNQQLLERKREDKPQFSMDMEFVGLTNNSYMEHTVRAIKHPLDKPYHQEFLTKREHLRALATEITLIFNGNAAIKYAEFVSCYENTLSNMYQYQIALSRTEKENEKRSMPVEMLQDSSLERHQRKNLYSAMDKFKDVFATLVDEKVDEKIRRQISLK